MQIGGKPIRLKRYNTYGPKDDASKNNGDNSFRNNQKSEKPYNKALNNGKKRDEQVISFAKLFNTVFNNKLFFLIKSSSFQGNKLRKRNLPNQIKKIKPNKGSESNQDSTIQNDSINNKHDESYKGTIAQKKKV